MRAFTAAVLSLIAFHGSFKPRHLQTGAERKLVKYPRSKINMEHGGDV